jgi:glutathione S-transferase
MRARLALLASASVCEIREVKLSAKPAEMLAASPKGTVPVLVLAENRVIEESLDIMHWALDRHDPEGWLKRQDPALIAINDGPFKHHLDRYKYPERHNSDPAAHRKEALGLLGPLETALARASHIHGARMGMTDAAIMPFIRQFAETDRIWFEAQPIPAIQAWLAHHIASPLFAACMTRLPPWQREDEPVLFPAA